MRGVITSADLRKLKRLALDQDYDAVPHPPSLGGEGGSTRPGFFLPVRMRYVHKSHAVWDSEKNHLIDTFVEELIGSAELRNAYGRMYDDEMLIELLYDEQSANRGEPLAAFSSLSCLAYRVMLVVKAIETRAKAVQPSASCGRIDERWLSRCEVGAMAHAAWTAHHDSR